MIPEDDLFAFDERAPRRRLQPSLLLEDLRSFGDQVPIERRGIKDYARWAPRRYHPHTVIKYFGTWSEAMRTAGVAHDPHARVRVCKEAVDEDLKRFAEAHRTHRRTMALFKS